MPHSCTILIFEGLVFPQPKVFQASRDKNGYFSIGMLVGKKYTEVYMPKYIYRKKT